jgi:hypothetical protein
MTKKIPLSNGMIAIIDDVDYEEVSKYKWTTTKSSNKFYARTHAKNKSGKWKNLYLHRLLMKPKGSKQTDHINGDSLDNRRCNLRLCNSYQNSWNKGASIGRKYKGVMPYKNKFKIYISKSYDTEKEAVAAYNDIALKLHGEFAFQNKFIENNE